MASNKYSLDLTSNMNKNILNLELEFIKNLIGNELEDNNNININNNNSNVYTQQRKKVSNKLKKEPIRRILSSDKALDRFTQKVSKKQKGIESNVNTLSSNIKNNNIIRLVPIKRNSEKLVNNIRKINKTIKLDNTNCYNLNGFSPPDNNCNVNIKGSSNNIYGCSRNKYSKENKTKTKTSMMLKLNKLNKEAFPNNANANAHIKKAIDKRNSINNVRSENTNLNTNNINNTNSLSSYNQDVFKMNICKMSKDNKSNKGYNCNNNSNDNVINNKCALTPKQQPVSPYCKKRNYLTPIIKKHTKININIKEFNKSFIYKESNDTNSISKRKTNNLKSTRNSLSEYKIPNSSNNNDNINKTSLITKNTVSFSSIKDKDKSYINKLSLNKRNKKNSVNSKLRLYTNDSKILHIMNDNSKTKSNITSKSSRKEKYNHTNNSNSNSLINSRLTSNSNIINTNTSNTNNIRKISNLVRENNNKYLSVHNKPNSSFKVSNIIENISNNKVNEEFEHNSNSYMSSLILNNNTNITNNSNNYNSNNINIRTSNLNAKRSFFNKIPSNANNNNISNRKIARREGNDSNSSNKDINFKQNINKSSNRSKRSKQSKNTSNNNNSQIKNYLEQQQPDHNNSKVNTPIIQRNKIKRKSNKAYIDKAKKIKKNKAYNKSKKTINKTCKGKYNNKEKSFSEIIERDFTDDNKDLNNNKFNKDYITTIRELMKKPTVIEKQKELEDENLLVNTKKDSFVNYFENLSSTESYTPSSSDSEFSNNSDFKDISANKLNSIAKLKKTFTNATFNTNKTNKTRKSSNTNIEKKVKNIYSGIKVNNKKSRSKKSSIDKARLFIKENNISIIPFTNINNNNTFNNNTNSNNGDIAYRDSNKESLLSLFNLNSLNHLNTNNNYRKYTSRNNNNTLFTNNTNNNTLHIGDITNNSSRENKSNKIIDNTNFINSNSSINNANAINTINNNKFLIPTNRNSKRHFSNAINHDIQIKNNLAIKDDEMLQYKKQQQNTFFGLPKNKLTYLNNNYNNDSQVSKISSNYDSLLNNIFVYSTLNKIPEKGNENNESYLDNGSFTNKKNNEYNDKNISENYNKNNNEKNEHNEYNEYSGNNENINSSFRRLISYGNNNVNNNVSNSRIDKFIDVSFKNNDYTHRNKTNNTNKSVSNKSLYNTSLLNINKADSNKNTLLSKNAHINTNAIYDQLKIYNKINKSLNVSNNISKNNNNNNNSVHSSFEEKKSINFNTQTLLLNNSNREYYNDSDDYEEGKKQVNINNKTDENNINNDNKTIINKTYIFSNNDPNYKNPNDPFYDEREMIKGIKSVYDSLSDDEQTEWYSPFLLLPDSLIIIILNYLLLIFLFISTITISLVMAFNYHNSITIKIINLITDLLLIISLNMNFITIKTNYSNLKNNFNKEIYSYLKTYFIVDLIMHFPFNSLLDQIKTPQDYFATSSLDNHLLYDFKITTYTFLLKPPSQLFQLTRLLRVTVIFKIMGNQNLNFCQNLFTKILSLFSNKANLLISLYSKIMAFLIKALLLFHLSSCLWVFFSYFSANNWVVYNKLEDSSTIDVYVSALYFNVSTIFSVGYGDIFAVNYFERTYNSFLLLFGVFFYTLAISSLSNYVYQSGENHKILEKQMQTLEELKVNYSISAKTYTKITSFLENSLLGDKIEVKGMLLTLPWSIKREILFSIYNKEIIRYSFLNKIDNNDVLMEILISLRHSLLTKNERLLEQGKHTEEMIFVSKGIVVLNYKIDLKKALCKEFKYELLEYKKYLYNSSNDDDSISMESQIEDYLYKKKSIESILSKIKSMKKAMRMNPNFKDLNSIAFCSEDCYYKLQDKYYINDNENENNIKKSSKTKIIDKCSCFYDNEKEKNRHNPVTFKNQYSNSNKRLSYKPPNRNTSSNIFSLDDSNLSSLNNFNSLSVSVLPSSSENVRKELNKSSSFLFSNNNNNYNSMKIKSLQSLKSLKSIKSLKPINNSINKNSPNNKASKSPKKLFSLNNMKRTISSALDYIYKINNKDKRSIINNYNNDNNNNSNYNNIKPIITYKTIKILNLVSWDSFGDMLLINELKSPVNAYVKSDYTQIDFLNKNDLQRVLDKYRDKLTSSLLISIRNFKKIKKMIKIKKKKVVNDLINNTKANVNLSDEDFVKYFYSNSNNKRFDRSSHKNDKYDSNGFLKEVIGSDLNNVRKEGYVNDSISRTSLNNNNNNAFDYSYIDNKDSDEDDNILNINNINDQIIDEINESSELDRSGSSYFDSEKNDLHTNNQNNPNTPNTKNNFNNSENVLNDNHKHYEHLGNTLHDIQDKDIMKDNQKERESIHKKSSNNDGIDNELRKVSSYSLKENNEILKLKENLSCSLNKTNSKNKDRATNKELIGYNKNSLCSLKSKSNNNNIRSIGSLFLSNKLLPIKKEKNHEDMSIIKNNLNINKKSENNDLLEQLYKKMKFTLNDIRDKESNNNDSKRKISMNANENLNKQANTYKNNISNKNNYYNIDESSPLNRSNKNQCNMLITYTPKIVTKKKKIKSSKNSETRYFNQSVKHYKHNDLNNIKNDNKENITNVKEQNLRILSTIMKMTNSFKTYLLTQINKKNNSIADIKIKKTNTEYNLNMNRYNRRKSCLSSHKNSLNKINKQNRLNILNTLNNSSTDMQILTRKKWNSCKNISIKDFYTNDESRYKCYRNNKKQLNDNSNHYTNIFNEQEKIINLVNNTTHYSKISTSNKYPSHNSLNITLNNISNNTNLNANSNYYILTQLNNNTEISQQTQSNKLIHQRSLFNFSSTIKTKEKINIKSKMNLINFRLNNNTNTTDSTTSYTITNENFKIKALYKNKLQVLLSNTLKNNNSNADCKPNINHSNKNNNIHDYSISNNYTRTHNNNVNSYERKEKKKATTQSSKFSAYTNNTNKYINNNNYFNDYENKEDNLMSKNKIIIRKKSTFNFKNNNLPIYDINEIAGINAINSIDDKKLQSISKELHNNRNNQSNKLINNKGESRKYNHFKNLNILDDLKLADNNKVHYTNDSNKTNININNATSTSNNTTTNREILRNTKIETKSNINNQNNQSYKNKSKDIERNKKQRLSKIRNVNINSIQNLNYIKNNSNHHHSDNNLISDDDRLIDGVSTNLNKNTIKNEQIRNTKSHKTIQTNKTIDDNKGENSKSNHLLDGYSKSNSNIKYYDTNINNLKNKRDINKHDIHRKSKYKAMGIYLNNAKINNNFKNANTNNKESNANKESSPVSQRSHSYNLLTSRYNDNDNSNIEGIRSKNTHEETIKKRLNTNTTNNTNNDGHSLLQRKKSSLPCLFKKEKHLINENSFKAINISKQRSEKKRKIENTSSLSKYNINIEANSNKIYGYTSVKTPIVRSNNRLNDLHNNNIRSINKESYKRSINCYLKSNNNFNIANTANKSNNKTIIEKSNSTLASKIGKSEKKRNSVQSRFNFKRLTNIQSNSINNNNSEITEVTNMINKYIDNKPENFINNFFKEKRELLFNAEEQRNIRAKDKNSFNANNIATTSRTKRIRKNSHFTNTNTTIKKINNLNNNTNITSNTNNVNNSENKKNYSSFNSVINLNNNAYNSNHNSNNNDIRSNNKHIKIYNKHSTNIKDKYYHKKKSRSVSSSVNEIEIDNYYDEISLFSEEESNN